MTEVLWYFVFLQVAMGGFDTLYHHELTERLAWRPAQRVELRLHGVRNLAYALIFAVLGWSEPRGAWAVALAALIVGELVITLWDFVEEDRTRRLPWTERVIHALLTLNYGVVLCMLAPVAFQWALLPSQLAPAFYWPWSWLCSIAAVGVMVSGARDMAAGRRVRHMETAESLSLAAGLPPRQAVLVTGGSGFIGRSLVASLVAAGHEVTVLTRDRAHAASLDAPLRIVTSFDQIAGDARIDAIVNLAGEPISDGLWTAHKRQRIIQSRLDVTRAVVTLVGRLRTPPEVLVSGSAFGWYGQRGDERLDELSTGTVCFSRDVCLAWEKEAMAAARLGVRVVCLRTGLVLAAEGGILSRMLVLFELGLGGRLGSGRQWMSWIHRDDLVRLIVYAIATPSLTGPVHGSAPVPVRNLDFTAALGRALARPTLLAAPAGILRLALGAFAEELLLGGQQVLPRAATDSGFEFSYPTIDEALAAIVGRRRERAAAPLLSKMGVPPASA